VLALSLNNIQWGEWEKEVLKSETPVVVEFWHQTCPACLKIEPQVKELNVKLNGKAKFVRLNVLESRENRRLAIQNGVMGTPTFKIYCRGIDVGEVIGEETLTDLHIKLEAIVEKCMI
jgi:thioredoxin 1